MDEKRKSINFDIYDALMIIVLILAVALSLFLLKDTKNTLSNLVNKPIDIRHIDNNIEVLEDIINNVSIQVEKIDFLNEEDKEKIEDNIRTSKAKVLEFKEERSKLSNERLKLENSTNIDNIPFIDLIDQIVLEINRFNKESIKLKTGNYIDYDVVNNFDNTYNDFQNKSLGIKNKFLGYRLLESYANFRISVDQLTWSNTRRILANHSTDITIRNLAVNEANFLFKLNVLFIFIALVVFIYNLIRQKTDKIFKASRSASVVLFLGSFIVLGLSYYTVLMKMLITYL